ncbi:aa3-type cytochrome c oxidase subunit IV [Rhizobiales bacterium TNE-4]|nr:aa3-type cytochrome c oxidase subunit IV [Rhizobiales bacterium TNE-4]MBV1827893.1 aa3-type cytochrome c oxidase subunit IV [Rhizobiales bacterium TNE-4]
MAESHSQGTGMDYPEHERTYEHFVTFVKWSTIAVCAIVVGMAIFLV